MPILAEQAREVMQMKQRKWCMMGLGQLLVSDYMKQSEDGLYGAVLDTVMHLRLEMPSDTAVDTKHVEEDGSGHFVKLSMTKPLDMDPCADMPDQMLVEILKKAYEMRHGVFNQERHVLLNKIVQ